MASTTRLAHRKCFIPLESNPTVFTELTHLLGVSPSLSFTDVLSLDDPDLLAIIPRPVLALVLVFPASEKYKLQKAEDEAKRVAYTGSGEQEDVVWFKQTIHNACGLYGILHSVTNGETRTYIQSDSTLSNILHKAIPLSPESRALSLEDSEELEKAHSIAANKGDSAVPELEEEVDYHYFCFVKSRKSGHLYLMDGDRKGPVDLGPVLGKEEDLLCEGAFDIVRKFIQGEDGNNTNFSLMALGPNLE